MQKYNDVYTNIYKHVLDMLTDMTVNYTIIIGTTNFAFLLTLYMDILIFNDCQTLYKNKNIASA